MKRSLQVLFIVLSSIFTTNASAQDTLTVEFGTGYIKDAYINIVNNFSNGDSESLIAAVWTYSGEYGMGRSLIGFDFSDLREDIVVIDARLNLYYNPTSSHIGHSTIGGENSGMIFRITRPWDEHLVNWVNQPPTTNTNAIFIPAPDNDTADFLNIDITPIISDMIRHPKTSDGFMIKLFNEDSLYRSLTFASSDHPVESLHPTVTITYVVDLPIDSSYTIQPDQETGKDASINSLISYLKDDNQSLVSSVWEYDEGWGTGRCFLDFDLSHIDNNQTVTLAELSLFHDPNSSISGHVNNGKSNELLISRITESWNDDELNWDNQPTFSLNNQVLVASSNIYNQDYLDIDVTDLFAEMLAQPDESYGFMIQLLDESSGNYNRNVVFASSDNDNPELRPKLTFYTHDYSGFEESAIINNRVTVFPNPSNGEFKIEVSENTDAIVCTVSDSFGNYIYASKSLNNKFTVDLVAQPPGVYFLTLIIDKRVITKKLIRL